LKILTEKQKAIYDILVKTPKTNRELAKHFGVKYPTIKLHITNLRKLGYKIKRKKISQSGYVKYWIEKNANIEDYPVERKVFENDLEYGKSVFESVKNLFENDLEYGKSVFESVKNLSTTLNSEVIKKRPTFRFKEPIGIIYLADLHLGLPHTLYDYLESLFKLISNTPNLLVVGLGDLIDNSVNALAPRGAVNIVDKNGQLAMLEYLINMVKGRILLLFEGNHESRSFISDHFQVNKYLSKKYLADYGRHGGRFDIDMNDNLVGIYCRHYGKGSSQYHPFQPNIRYVMYDQAPEAYDADIIVSAHKHESGTAHFRIGHKKRHLMVCGFAALYHEWADRMDFHPVPYNFPLNIIERDGTIRSYDDTQTGIRDLKRLVK
jgi:DNA-binding MarR family transcriptional regulator